MCFERVDATQGEYEDGISAYRVYQIGRKDVLELKSWGK